MPPGHPVVAALRAELASLERDWRALNDRTTFVWDALTKVIALYGESAPKAPIERQNAKPPIPQTQRARPGGPTETILHIVHERPGIAFNELLDSATLLSNSGALNSQANGSAVWRKAWGLFMYRQEDFLKHYHARSNAESTFSAVKRKFGASVRSKNPTAQVNEVLCKALCFNLSMLVHAMYELGIDPTFNGVVRE